MSCFTGSGVEAPPKNVSANPLFRNIKNRMGTHRNNFGGLCAGPGAPKWPSRRTRSRILGPVPVGTVPRP
jgi:hypothetical protein